jgi:dTDP-4-amino-4,6-dideoxygalactose transaminase
MARSTFLNFSPPSIGQEEIDEVVDTLRSGWITTGPKTGQFERAFSEYFQAPAALALNSCTAGLHSALVALGIGPGDEVITTCLTFAASVNVIEHVGARPILVDVEPDTLNLDATAVERAITPRTRAILPVHFAGHPVDLDAIHRLAARHKLAVLEDAAHAVGAKYRGRWIGSGPNPVAFSFYATKNMTTGEGGMLTGDEELISQARIISLHGMSREAWRRYEQGGSWRYDVVLPGFKYNMTDIQAALGICQLRRLSEFQRRRQQIAEAYGNAFCNLEEIERPACRPEVKHAWHLYVVRLKTAALRIGRDQFVDELTNRKIGTSVHFIPIHLHPFYRNKYGFQEMDFPVAYDSFLRMLSLPLNPAMSDQDVADVIEAVHDIVQRFRVVRRAA